jgi:tRNA(Ile)-lysidine synthase
MNMAEPDRYFVLRPCLSVNRQEIDAYCQENKLSPVFDESNEDVSFFRNRIRQELLPLLADYNAGIRTHLQQLAELSAADVELLDGLASDAWPQVVTAVYDRAVVIDRVAWMALPLGLRRAILRQAVVVQRPFLQDITFQAIEQARLIAERNETGQRFSLPGDLFLLVDYDRFIVTDNEQIVLDDYPQLVDGQSQKLPVPGTVELAGGWKLETKLVDRVEVAEIHTVSDKWLVFVSMPVNQSFIVRTREPGERFQPLGMNGRSAKLKEVMINRKVGIRWRENWPIIANDTHLVWFVGHSIDERVKITKETESIIQIHCFKG